MTENDPIRFSDDARELLDESINGLDAATLSKLHQARNIALDQESQGVPLRQWGFGGAVLSSFLLMGIYFYQLTPPLPEIYADPIQQASAENIELLDDLEFFAWLLLEESSLKDGTIEDNESEKETTRS